MRKQSLLVLSVLAAATFGSVKAQEAFLTYPKEDVAAESPVPAAANHTATCNGDKESLTLDDANWSGLVDDKNGDEVAPASWVKATTDKWRNPQPDGSETARFNYELKEGDKKDLTMKKAIQIIPGEIYRVSYRAWNKDNDESTKYTMWFGQESGDTHKRLFIPTHDKTSGNEVTVKTGSETPFYDTAFIVSNYEDFVLKIQALQNEKDYLYLSNLLIEHIDLDQYSKWGDSYEIGKTSNTQYLTELKEFFKNSPILPKGNKSGTFARQGGDLKVKITIPADAVPIKMAGAGNLDKTKDFKFLVYRDDAVYASTEAKDKEYDTDVTTKITNVKVGSTSKTSAVYRADQSLSFDVPVPEPGYGVFRVVFLGSDGEAYSESIVIDTNKDQTADNPGWIGPEMPTWAENGSATMEGCQSLDGEHDGFTFTWTGAIGAETLKLWEKTTGPVTGNDNEYYQIRYYVVREFVDGNGDVETTTFEPITKPYSQHSPWPVTFFFTDTEVFKKPGLVRYGVYAKNHVKADGPDHTDATKTATLWADEVALVGPSYEVFAGSDDKAGQRIAEHFDLKKNIAFFTMNDFDNTGTQKFWSQKNIDKTWIYDNISADMDGHSYAFVNNQTIWDEYGQTAPSEAEGSLSQILYTQRIHVAKVERPTSGGNSATTNPGTIVRFETNVKPAVYVVNPCDLSQVAELTVQAQWVKNTLNTAEPWHSEAGYTWCNNNDGFLKDNPNSTDANMYQHWNENFPQIYEVDLSDYDDQDIVLAFAPAEAVAPGKSFNIDNLYIREHDDYNFDLSIIGFKINEKQVTVCEGYNDKGVLQSPKHEVTFTAQIRNNGARLVESLAAHPEDKAYIVFYEGEGDAAKEVGRTRLLMVAYNPDQTDVDDVTEPDVRDVVLEKNEFFETLPVSKTYTYEELKKGTFKFWAKVFYVEDGEIAEFQPGAADDGKWILDNNTSQVEVLTVKTIAMPEPVELHYELINDGQTARMHWPSYDATKEAALKAGTLALPKNETELLTQGWNVVDLDGEYTFDNAGAGRHAARAWEFVSGKLTTYSTLEGCEASKDVLVLPKLAKGSTVKLDVRALSSATTAGSYSVYVFETLADALAFNTTKGVNKGTKTANVKTSTTPDYGVSITLSGNQQYVAICNVTPAGSDKAFYLFAVDGTTAPDAVFDKFLILGGNVVGTYAMDKYNEWNEVEVALGGSAQKRSVVAQFKGTDCHWGGDDAELSSPNHKSYCYGQVSKELTMTPKTAVYPDYFVWNDFKDGTNDYDWRYKKNKKSEGVNQFYHPNVLGQVDKDGKTRDEEADGKTGFVVIDENGNDIKGEETDDHQIVVAYASKYHSPYPSANWEYPHRTLDQVGSNDYTDQAKAMNYNILLENAEGTLYRFPYAITGTEDATPITDALGGTFYEFSIKSDDDLLRETADEDVVATLDVAVRIAKGDRLHIHALHAHTTEVVEDITLTGTMKHVLGNPSDGYANDIVKAEYYEQSAFDGDFVGFVNFKVKHGVDYRMYLEKGGLEFLGFNVVSVERVAKEGTTEIETVESGAPAETVIYDLYGRRVENPVHGQTYIVNGKTVRM